VVYSEQGFGTLSASDHAVANTKLVDLDLQPYQIPKAQLLKIPMYLTPEPNSADYAQFLANLFNGYPGPRERSDQYVAIDSRPDELGKGIMTTEVLAEQGILAAVKKAANENKVQLKDIHVYKFQARYDKGVLLFDPKTHRIVDYVSWDLATEQVAEAES